MAKKGRNIGRRNQHRDDDIKEATGNVTGTRKTSKRIEDAVSEAMDFLSDNPTETSRNIPKDPKVDKNALRRKSVGQLGTDVGTMVGARYNRTDGLTPEPGAKKFSMGGDVRYNSNRGKTY
jgi:hypothetical protein